MIALWAFILGTSLATPNAADTAIASGNATARQEAAVFLGNAHDTHSLILLWELSFDPEPDVRQAALDASTHRCTSESTEVCAAMLSYFTDDIITEISWTARDRLLPLDVELGLRGASVAYKLDLLTELAGDNHLPAPALAKILRTLSSDPDSAVQENAAWLLERTP